MGHNFGMSHDFDNKHGGQGGPCDGHGIMSYNSDKPMKWSDCSVRDFTGYYNDQKWGATCLKGMLHLSDLFMLSKLFHDWLIIPSITLRLEKVCSTMPR